MNYRFHVLLISLLISGLGYASTVSAQEIHACVVIPGEVTSGQFAPSSGPGLSGVVQKAVALGGPGTNFKSNSNFWTAGGTLRVKFMGGSDYVRRQVVRYSREWSRYANVDFTFVTSGQSDIRVSFVQNGSSWSMLGRQARSASSNQATMNFGWLNDRTPDYEFRRTILHEFGHALGLLHEHQNPSGGIPWDEEEVYAFYQRTQGWDRRTTYHNVIARQGHNETQYSAYDPASIMHYPVDPRLTRDGYKVGLNTAISATDARFIARMYPGRNFTPPTTTATPPTAPSEPERPVVVDKPTGQPTSAPTRRVATGTHELTISNSLGQRQRAEVVELEIAGRKHTFQLREGSRSSQSIRLRLREGVYPYRVSTASVYTVMKRVREGNRYVERRRQQKVYGNGSGKLRVDGDGRLVFYGSYDKQSGKMSVYLGEE